MIQIREYTQQDHEDFCRLNRAWISEHWQLEQRDYDEMEQMRDGVEGGFVLVALDHTHIVGTIAFLPMDGREYDYELAKFTVRQDMRGKGIGRMLMKAALDKAARERGKRVYIITNKLCHSAIHLYEQFGFEKIPGRSNLFSRGDYLMASRQDIKQPYMKIKTKAIDTPFQKKDAYGALAMPVYHTCAYEFDTAAQMTDAFTGRVLEPDYSRVMNPTVTYLEDKVKTVTGAANVYAFNSGMQAITNALLSIAEAGKTIVTSPHLFGNTFSLITKTLARLGVRNKIVNLINLDDVEKALDDDSVCLLFLEIITNPQMEVADIKAIAERCHRHGVALVADTTMIPFTEFRSGDLGVDIEVVSSTKYISGGATSLGGLVIDYGTLPQVDKRIRYELLFNIGGYMTPHAAYMQTLGLETLTARYSVQQQNTSRVAHALRDMPQIRRVNYLGFEDNPYHALSQRQFGPTSGCMITIDLDSEQACYDFLDSLRLIRRATNLFDNKTLAIHPYSTIFGNFSPQEKAAMDVYPTTIRLSIGLEDSEDIINDIKQALS